MNDREPSQQYPLGVFASVDAGLGVRLDVAQDLGAPTLHLHAPHRGNRGPDVAAEFRTKLERRGLRVTVVFAGFDGESYADIPTVEKTVGLAPPDTRAERLAELKEIIDFTAQLGVEATGLHLGFVPHDPADPEFSAIVDATRDACDYARQRGVNIHLETGQEPAGVLATFLETVQRDNLYVNFDPANMILYGCGEPIFALKEIVRYVRSVHCKDAKWSDSPGETWGQETPLGEGDVDFPAFLRTLQEGGYRGPLTIEREIPQEPERQRAEIAAAIAFLNQLLSGSTGNGGGSL
ncbi:Xylose isomerase-like TIM barrel [Posidoniimonas polymericola]|uniref:Xylose isomerase-like TIM barrel n=1 Tax=Posidoniimonas polymericola TaxID=2528002 RepID=A0A5C5YL33_9BACT|nr:sugar phosphate isomerase/epimerase family protein [Posidoniimonas polymericola]TWT75582.1 Xylose isomerase-like TIM barrel [Posidoniimonas polymericola]